MVRYHFLVSAIFTFVLIVMGAAIRLNDAGLSCPDWPLCFGQVIPPPGFRIALEVSHRFVATFLGIIILHMTYLCIKRPEYKRFKKRALICLAIVLIQGILGGLTVLMTLFAPVVTLHLIGGATLFSILVFTTSQIFFDWGDESIRDEVPGNFDKSVLAMLILFFLMMLSGSINSTTYSGAACSAFPGCEAGSNYSISIIDRFETDGEFWPAEFDAHVHMTHRVTVITGGLILIFSIFRFWISINLFWKKIGYLLIFCIIFQFSVGILNAITGKPGLLSSFHTMVAVSIVGILSFAYQRSFSSE